VRALRRQVAELERANEILKTSAAFFAQAELDRRLRRSLEPEQYVSVAFTAELIDAGIAGSIGTVGDALDNALCESTIGLFKTEAINLPGPAWADRRDVEWQVARWVHWYNTDRLQSSIRHLPPIEFEQHHWQARTETPDREVA
jgi:putative transposase